MSTVIHAAHSLAERFVDWLKNNEFAEGAYENFTHGSWKDHTRLACIPGNRMSFGSTMKHHWAASLVQRLDQCGLLLTTGGKDPPGHTNNKSTLMPTNGIL